MTAHMSRGPLPDAWGFMADEIAEVLVSEADLQAKVRELGARIASDYAGKDLLLITVLKGGFIFLADLCRAITLPLTIDVMAVSSYGPGARPLGVVKILKDLDESITGREVLVVEDVIDTGLTLSYLLRNLQPRAPASLNVCVLLDKRARRIADLPIAYRGFEIPDKFVVGYGLDFAQRYRNLPFVATLTKEAMDHLNRA
ncbi:MAG: hypoxanthine-guanine phosphoribosyltransferase, HGPRTase, HGPRT [candidate division NC10 bacterium CSP1-5]|nr:MAG: hypoxanthine-guanine phosphoribosyltransferase, HGPRTase, HGPRT [candidate division NC10 bacterium CSP1-5]